MTGNWSGDLQSFEKALRHRGLQASTVRSYSTDAKGFLEYLNKNNIKFINIENQFLNFYLEVFQEKYHGKPNSVRRKVIGIKQFFRHLVEAGKLERSPFDESPIPSRVEKKKNLAPLQPLNTFIHNQNLGTNLKDARDRAALALLAIEGLKVGELILLQWSDFHPAKSKGTLRIPGQRARVISLCDISLLHLKHYKTLFTEVRPLTQSQKIFLGFKGRDAALTLGSVTRHGIKHLIYEYGAKFNIKHLNGESLRHLAIQFQISTGKSGDEIMAHLGLKRIGNIAAHLNEA